MNPTPEKPLGFLRSCMDKRFVATTRTAFEQASGLGPTDYWHEAYAGGSAINAANDVGLLYAHEHGASIFGWQAHIDHCGGQPGVSDEEIANRLNRVVVAMMNKFPRVRHFRLLASETGVDVKEFSPHTTVVLRKDKYPVPPSDVWFVTNNTGANDPTANYPVLEFCGYTYWPSSYTDNRMGMAILAYDAAGKLVQRWDKAGARYIASIGIDTEMKTVIFTGQSNAKIVMSWNELIPV